jgi:MraZ protein
MEGELNSQIIFAGDFQHVMDAKNRITIPARWRRSEIDEFYTVPSPRGEFLRVIPPEQMKRISEEVRNNQAISPRDRAIFERGFYSRANHVVTDRQGRILLSEEHCEQAQLSNEVILVGVDRWFEIWNPERWKATLATETATYEQISGLVGLQ